LVPYLPDPESFSAYCQTSIIDEPNQKHENGLKYVTISNDQHKEPIETQTIGVQSENNKLKIRAPPPPKPDSPPISEARPHSRASADDLARLETEVRQKIGKIYEKITGFVQSGNVDPKSIRIRNQSENYEHLEIHQNRPEPTNPMISRQVTPEAGEFDFQSFHTNDNRKGFLDLLFDSGNCGIDQKPK
jgi:hypothetical protein